MKLFIYKAQDQNLKNESSMKKKFIPQKILLQTLLNEIFILNKKIHQICTDKTFPQCVFLDD